MPDQQCRRAPGKRMDIDGRCVIVWDSREDFCSLPVTYAVDVYVGDAAIRLAQHIERVPFATKPGATFVAKRDGEADEHYASIAGAAGHVVHWNRPLVEAAEAALRRTKEAAHA